MLNAPDSKINIRANLLAHTVPESECNQATDITRLQSHLFIV